MGIKTIPLSELEADPRGTLSQCAASGQALLVQMPDQQLIAFKLSMRATTIPLLVNCWNRMRTFRLL